MPHLPDAGRRSTTLKWGMGRAVPVSVIGVALRSPIAFSAERRITSGLVGDRYSAILTKNLEGCS